MLEKKAITKIQQWISKRESSIKEESTMHAILSDQTRIKILMLLKEYNELCVTDIAECLSMTLSAVSHQLRTLERNGLVTKKKMGLTVCYYPKKQSTTLFSLFKNKFNHN